MFSDGSRGVVQLCVVLPHATELLNKSVVELPKCLVSLGSFPINPPSSEQKHKLQLLHRHLTHIVLAPYATACLLEMLNCFLKEETVQIGSKLSLQQCKFYLQEALVQQRNNAWAQMPSLLCC